MHTPIASSLATVSVLARPSPMRADSTMLASDATISAHTSATAAGGASEQVAVIG